MIDRNCAVPMYVQLANVLSESIRQGGYRKTGGKLPSESELCARFQVSRITVRQALTLLAQQDLVVSVHGKGTFVKSPTISHDLQRIVSFSKLLQLQGLSGCTHVHGFDARITDEKAQTLLGDALSRLCLIGWISDKPAVYYYSFFNPKLGARMLDAAVQAEKGRRAFSTYDLYADVGVTPFSVEQTMSAVNATSELEGLLNVPARKALIKLESIYYDENRAPLEYKVAYYHSDIYSFRLQREI